MPDSEQSDTELLIDWLEHRRERAFRGLVERYSGLVHRAATRRCGDETLSAEVSQLTFISLARKAKSLRGRTSLGGWLHLTAMMHANNLIRRRIREHRKLQCLKSHMETDSHAQASAGWSRIEPVLDEAMAALSAKDRETLILRYYCSLGTREIASALGIATDAAQKRLERALDRLRVQLGRRGCHAGGSLSAAMAAGLGADANAAVSTASALASNAIAAGSGSTLTPIAITIMTKQTNTIAAGIVLVLAGAGTIALIRHNDSTPTATPSHAADNRAETRTQPAFGPAAGNQEAKRTRVRKEMAYPDLAKEYGESRTNLSRHVVGNVVGLVDEFLALNDQIDTKIAPDGNDPNTGNFMKATLGDLDGLLNLTDDQRAKAERMFADQMREDSARMKATSERIKQDPSVLMRRILAGDAFAHGKITGAEFKRLRDETSRDLGGFDNLPLFGRRGDTDDAEFLKSLMPLLDESQARLVQGRLDESAAAGKSAADAGAPTGIQAMDLEKLDATVIAAGKMTGALKSMMEGANVLESQARDAEDKSQGR